MVETVRMESPADNGFSTVLSIRKDGSFVESPLDTTRETTRASQHMLAADSHPTQHRIDSTDGLVSILLGDTTKDGEQTTDIDRHLHMSGLPTDPAFGQTNPALSSLEEQFAARLANNAMANNLKAWKANRKVQATNQALTALRHDRAAPVVLQPKTTSRQKKGTVRQRRISQGNNGPRPVRPTGSALDRSGPSLANQRFSPDMRRHSAKRPGKGPEASIPGSLARLFSVSGDTGRRYEDFLPLNGTTALDPAGAEGVRRSKTTHNPPRTTYLAKQKSVLKKMTGALADRLHLTHKTSDSEVKYSDTEANRFFQDTIAGWPISKPRVASSRTPPRGKASKTTQQPVGAYIDPDNLSEDDYPAGSCRMDDPFAEEDASRNPTPFVNRLKASSFLASTRSKASNSVPNPFETENVMGGSVDSLLPSPPDAASTPRVSLSQTQPLAFDDLTTKSAAMGTKSSTSISHPNPGVSSVNSAGDEHIVSSGQRLAQRGGYTYLPVSDDPEFKKHPSPNKIDLQFFETRLHSRFFESADADEKKLKKKHPSPLKKELQNWKKDFRQAYPTLCGDAVVEECDCESVAGESGHDMVNDELALSESSTPEKPVLPRYKSMSTGGFGTKETGNIHVKRRAKTMMATSRLSPCGPNMLCTVPRKTCQT